jgi:hypothetical protein
MGGVRTGGGVVDVDEGGPYPGHGCGGSERIMGRFGVRCLDSKALVNAGRLSGRLRGRLLRVRLLSMLRLDRGSPFR